MPKSGYLFFCGCSIFLLVILSSFTVSRPIHANSYFAVATATSSPIQNTPAFGTRTNPILIGQGYSFYQDKIKFFTLTLTESYTGNDALKRLQAMNSLNSAAPKGHDFVLAYFEITYDKGPDDDPLILKADDFQVVSKSQYVFSSSLFLTLANPHFDLSLFPGAVTGGWVAKEIITGDTSPFIVFASNGGKGGFYFSTSPLDTGTVFDFTTAKVYQSSDKGISIQLPEGWSRVHSEEKGSYVFQSGSDTNSSSRLEIYILDANTYYKRYDKSGLVDNPLKALEQLKKSKSGGKDPYVDYGQVKQSKLGKWDASEMDVSEIYAEAKYLPITNKIVLAQVSPSVLIEVIANATKGVETQARPTLDMMIDSLVFNMDVLQGNVYTTPATQNAVTPTVQATPAKSVF